MSRSPFKLHYVLVAVWTTNFIKCDNGNGHEECLRGAIEDAVFKLKDGKTHNEMIDIVPNF